MVFDDAITICVVAAISNVIITSDTKQIVIAVSIVVAVGTKQIVIAVSVVVAIGTKQIVIAVSIVVAIGTKQIVITSSIVVAMVFIVARHRTGRVIRSDVHWTVLVRSCIIRRRGTSGQRNGETNCGKHCEEFFHGCTSYPVGCP
ncbi:hypothetical protein [Aneurinibacillus migulanus]|uniref:hypothetical protein n=1 Tax=Aneurinibacillus migulanus TaxID=47500 RepID=UPI00111338A7|nr:hypothetical protein [Aneurinibacillus migulanus]MED0892798.1 hypothetical protein [Aneurinibacillus migulanus]MED1619044.1 hypothetical protein [Aneurinibacillus migulanus]